jgi:hypothetical protein
MGAALRTAGGTAYARRAEGRTRGCGCPQLSSRAVLCLRGELVVIGKQPDGDSIRFVPDTPALIDRLDHAERARTSSDGSLQLRVEGIDAPETHYNTLAQPLGDSSRDRLLALCGFTNVRHGTGSDAQTVIAATPERIAAAILSHIVDVNGRPVSFLLVGDALPPDGGDVPIDDALLQRTLNAELLADGSAYLTVYASLDEPLRTGLRTIAAAADDRGLGVWPLDASAAFTLATQASIGPGGALILPKLFRRCTDYLRTRTAGETLPDWLRARPDTEDDEVSVAGGPLVRLSDLVEQRGDEIALTAPLLDLVFQER